MTINVKPRPDRQDDLLLSPYSHIEVVAQTVAAPAGSRYRMHVL